MNLKAILYLFILIFIFPTYVLGVNDGRKFSLDELAANYEKVARQNDMDAELAALEPYLAEAIRQNDVTEEQYARISKVYCYFNYDEYDLLYDEIDRQMAYFREKGWWAKYYACATLRVEALIYQNKPISALREADDQYSKAPKTGNPMALVAAAYNLFICYQKSERNEEAALIFEKDILPNMEYIPSGSESNYYTVYSDVLMSLGRYDDLLKHAVAYEKLIDQTEERQRRDGIVSDNSVHRFYVCVSYAEAYLGLGQLVRADSCYEKALTLTGNRSNDCIALFALHARILQHRGKYTDAIIAVNNSLKDSGANDNQSVRNYHLSMKADILHDAGYFAESSATYRQIVALTDSIARADLSVQLNDLRSIYKLDRLTFEKEQAHFYLVIALLVCGAMMVIVILYIIYSRRLKTKNLILFDRIQEQTRLEQARRKEEGTSLSLSEPVQESDTAMKTESQLFCCLRNLLLKEKLHLTPEFNRDMLLSRLGTNKNKLSEAIFSATGYNLTEYITQLRLQEALILMETQPDLPFAYIAEQTGFGVYSSFYRAFCKCYGVKPTEYRSFRKA